MADAFHQAPLHHQEARYTAALFRGKYYVFRVLVFGSGSSPTVWGRFAAFLGRSTSAVCPPSHLRMEIYVDDPVYAARGPRGAAAREIGIALVWAATMGFPFAWRKSDGGQSLRWIGALATVDLRSITVSVPPEKATEIAEPLAKAIRRNVVMRSTLRSLAGKISFLAGLVPNLKPYLATLWAVCTEPAEAAHHETSRRPACSSGCPGKRGVEKALPPRLVFTRQCLPGLKWLLAFFQNQRGTLERCYHFAGAPDELTLQAAVDASPWGIGGVLIRNGIVTEWFADDLTPGDEKRLRAKIGVSAHVSLLGTSSHPRRPTHLAAEAPLRGSSRGRLRFAYGTVDDTERVIDLASYKHDSSGNCTRRG